MIWCCNTSARILKDNIEFVCKMIREDCLVRISNEGLGRQIHTFGLGRGFRRQWMPCSTKNGRHAINCSNFKHVWKRRAAICCLTIALAGLYLFQRVFGKKVRLALGLHMARHIRCLRGMLPTPTPTLTPPPRVGFLKFHLGRRRTWPMEFAALNMRCLSRSLSFENQITSVCGPQDSANRCAALVGECQTDDGLTGSLAP